MTPQFGPLHALGHSSNRFSFLYISLYRTHIDRYRELVSGTCHLLKRDLFFLSFFLNCANFFGSKMR
jgi:hypothetical protein